MYSHIADCILSVGGGVCSCQAGAEHSQVRKSYLHVESTDAAKIEYAMKPVETVIVAVLNPDEGRITIFMLRYHDNLIGIVRQYQAET